MAKQRRDAPQGSPRYDAYTGMLIVSLLATLTGLAFLYLDYSQYPEKLPNLGSMAPKPLSGPLTPQPAPGEAAGSAPGGQPPAPPAPGAVPPKT